MNIEAIFAAAVFNAEANAAKCRAAGIPQATADGVGCALADLWACGSALGLRNRDIQEIADRHVIWDGHGEAWPRPVEGGNVVQLGS